MEKNEEDHEEETLSLSDLPLIHHNQDDEKVRAIESIESSSNEDFDFCSLSKESEMCSADEVFFQGQILPLRHSVSSTRPVSKSESMDHLHSGGFVSSRSSSISSASSSSKSRPGLPPRIRQTQLTRIPHRNSSILWNIFRLPGPQEIAFHNVKARRSTSSNNGTNCRNFGSRNSTSSNSSSMSGSSNMSKKKKARMFFGGGTCSYGAVDTVPTKVVTIKRSASGGEVEELEKPERTKKEATKKQLSHHRTFEWLKQLSLEV